MSDVEGGLTERQWERFEPPDLSQYVQGYTEIPLEQARGLADMTIEDLNVHFPALTGVAGQLDLNFRTGEGVAANGPLLAKYGGLFYSAGFEVPLPGRAIIDVVRQDPPSRANRAAHAVGQVIHYLSTGKRMAPLPAEPSAVVSMLVFPPARPTPEAVAYLPTDTQ